MTLNRHIYVWVLLGEVSDYNPNGNYWPQQLTLTILPNQPPLSSDRQYLSYGVCLEVRGEIIRTVLCCIVYDSCAQS